MAHERQPHVGPVGVEHPGSGADHRLDLLEIAVLFDDLPGDDGDGVRVRHHVEEPGERLPERELHGVLVGGLDLVDRPQHVGVGVALHRQEVVHAEHDVVGRQFAAVHRRLVVPAHAAAQLEHVGGVVGLRPRLGEVPLDREGAGSDLGTRLVLEQAAVGEAQRDVGLVGDRLERIEVRGVPRPQGERAAALGRLGARAAGGEHGPGQRETSGGQQQSHRAENSAKPRDHSRLRHTDLQRLH